MEKHNTQKQSNYLDYLQKYSSKNLLEKVLKKRYDLRTTDSLTLIVEESYEKSNGKTTLSLRLNFRNENMNDIKIRDLTIPCD